MQHLKELIELGFSPMIALVIVVVIVLWATLCAVVVFMNRSQTAERNKREALRQEWHHEIEERLNSSEEKHAACDADRSQLRIDIDRVTTDLERMQRCTNRDCPMRIKN